MFFLFTRKLYWKWKKFWCNFTAWVRLQTTCIETGPISSGGESEFPLLFGPRFLLTFFPVLWLCQAVHYLFLCDFLVLEFIIAQLFISQFSLWFPCHRISWWEVLRCGTDTECSKTKYFEIDPSFTAAPIAKSCSFSNGVWAEKAGIKDQSPGPW